MSQVCEIRLKVVLFIGGEVLSQVSSLVRWCTKSFPKQFRDSLDTGGNFSFRFWGLSRREDPRNRHGALGRLFSPQVFLEQVLNVLKDHWPLMRIV